VKEIKAALFQMHLDKAPGPDGFNAFFFQRNWEMVKDNVVQSVLQFFKTRKILKHINHTFFTLIPKSNEASSLADYRPISCCNIIYKIISKVLSNRLQSVDCLKITEDKSSESRVYTPDARLIIVTRAIPR